MKLYYGKEPIKIIARTPVIKLLILHFRETIATSYYAHLITDQDGNTLNEQKIQQIINSNDLVNDVIPIVGVITNDTFDKDLLIQSICATYTLTETHKRLLKMYQSKELSCL